MVLVAYILDESAPRSFPFTSFPVISSTS